ncbi:MAG: hypothetical protein U0531_06095 [Dehalococcoidia bacterium]
MSPPEHVRQEHAAALIGVNIVLAQAGGPVCACAMRLPPVTLWTSMRIRDSLERGVVLPGRACSG